MNLTESQILQTLMSRRTRISAAAWVVVQDTHAAEDIFQNVALKAMTRPVQFESEGSLLSWAFITARREGIDWLRKHQRETLCLDAEILDLLEQEWRSAAGPTGGDRMDALRECLARAPDAARQLLRLRYFEGQSCKEVAARMGLGLDAVYKRLSRLHEDLKSCMENRLRHIGPPTHPGTA